jgi:hypothetical protein
MACLRTALAICIVASCTLTSLSCAHDWNSERAPSVELAPDAQAPLLWWGTNPVVEVPLDGHGPYRFVIDTGSTGSTVSPALVEALHLEVRKTSRQGVDAAGHVIQPGGVVHFDRMEVGGSRFNDFSADVLELPALGAMEGNDVVGLLGLNVFRDVVITIDYPAQRVELSRRPLPPPDGKDTFPLLAPAGIPVVDLDIGGHTYSVQVDTGDNAFVELSAAAAQGHRYVSDFVVTSVHSLVGGDEFESRQARLALDVQLGRYRLEQPVVELTPGPSRIGGELLKEFRLTIDQPSRRVRFERESAAPITSRGVTGHGFGATLSPKGGTILYVLPGTPAAQALAPGDLILEWDGLSTDKVMRSPLRGGCKLKSTAHYVVERHGERRTVDLPCLELVK